MQKRLNHLMLLFVILAVVMTSAFRTTTVHADDGVTEPPTGESTPPPSEEGASVEETSPATESVAATEVPAAEPVAEEPVAVSEVLEQLPEGTNVTVLNDAGSPEPLATQEAADIVQSGDPRYTVGGTTYYFMPTGGCGALPNCTESVTPIQAAIDALSGAGATPDDGTIYIDAGTYTENVTVNGNSWSGGSTPAALTVSGAGSATTILNGSLSIANMNTFTLSGITVMGATSTAAAIDVSNNAGILTLDDVSATNTAGNGASLDATGNVVVTDSHFSGSAGNGLIVRTRGNIDVTTVTASNNSLTGAYLDSCRYGTVDPGLCAGSGVVTVTGVSLFNGNGSNGLVVDAGGDIALANVGVNGNSLGAKLTSADEDGAGNVSVAQSAFDANVNGVGLDIFTGGSIDIDDVQAYLNRTGAVLDTTYANGSITVDNSEFGVVGAGNSWTGLHALSGGAIDLTSVEASDNGANGAYLVAEGDINVTGGTFNSNVQGNYPDDPGLRAISFNGDITLDNVVASENVYGPGAGLDVFGAHTITVNNSSFNQNGTFGIQAGSDDGSITLNNVIASYNQVKGAYLGAFSAGNIIIDNSVFIENGLYGIYAFTSEGNISLGSNTGNVYVTGSDGAVGPGADDLTDYGAFLQAGGDVTVTNSTFQINTNVGLEIVSGGQVNLSNVVADSNGGNGVEVYSLSTTGPICQGESPVNISVTVAGGTFTNNGSYGLMVKPGPTGTLVFSTPATFGGNGLGDYLLDLSQEFKDCTCPPEPEEPPSKGPKIVDVPETGGPTVEQDCDQYTGTILRLPNGTQVEIGCPFEGFSKLEQVLQANLPGPFGAGINFADAISFALTDAQGNIILNEDGTVTISFAIPEGSHARGYSILFWDEKANNGAGAWVELPPYEVGTRFPLNPKDPDDHRTIFSGVKQVGDVVTTTINFSGVFALVER